MEDIAKTINRNVKQSIKDLPGLSRYPFLHTMIPL